MSRIEFSEILILQKDHLIPARRPYQVLVYKKKKKKKKK